MSSGTSGNFSVNKMRTLLMEFGHLNAEFMPDAVVEQWFNNYVARIKDNLDAAKTKDAKILDILVDRVLLVESDDETESHNR